MLLTPAPRVPQLIFSPEMDGLMVTRHSINNWNVFIVTASHHDNSVKLSIKHPDRKLNYYECDNCDVSGQELEVVRAEYIRTCVIM